MEELQLAIRMTNSSKAPGLDSLPAELYKYGGAELQTTLLQFFCDLWHAGTLPQDFKDPLIVTIYKRKGDRQECGNHRGILSCALRGKFWQNFC